MKKVALIVGLALLLVFTFGCEKEAVEEEPAMSDGTYTTYSSASDRGGFVQAEVTIEDDGIVGVELAEYQNDYVPKDEDYDWDEWHEAMKVLPERFIEANSHEVDIITDATSTSNMAIDAVEKALTRASGDEDPFDGTFVGRSDESDRGAYGVATVTVVGGEIEDVGLEEVQDDGEFKNEDNYDYEEFFEAQEEMPKRFAEANSPDVDIYTGATGSSEMWMQAVKRALEKAGIETELPEPEEEADEEAVEPEEEAFTGTGEGFIDAIEVEVTMLGDEIINIEVLSQNETPDYWENGKQTVEDILEAQSIEVDTETGATGTSKGIVDAVNDAVGDIIN